MLDKIPPDRRSYLFLAIGLGSGAGYWLERMHDPVQGAIAGLALALAVTWLVLSAAGGGDLAALLNATRNVGDGRLPARPVGVGRDEAALYDALDTLANKITTGETRAVTVERTSDERRSELE